LSKNTHITITILDPERWYLKFSEKRKHYVQLHASYWLDSDFCSLELPTKTAFLWILSQCLRVNKPSVSICLESACMFLKVPLGTCKVMLRELKSCNIIDMERHLRSQLIEEKRKEKNRSKEKILYVISDEQFEEAWKLYGKIGNKKTAREKFTQSINSSEMYSMVMNQIDNYKTYLSRIDQYPKHFVTWINKECWNDDYKVEKPEVFDPFAKEREENEDYRQ